MMELKGVAYIIGGASIWVLGIIVWISWLAFCFGTVVVGVVLMIVAPPVLFLPSLIFPPGTALFIKGMDIMKGEQYS